MLIGRGTGTQYLQNRIGQGGARGTEIVSGISQGAAAHYPYFNPGQQSLDLHSQAVTPGGSCSHFAARHPYIAGLLVGAVQAHEEMAENLWAYQFASGAGARAGPRRLSTGITDA